MDVFTDAVQQGPVEETLVIRRMTGSGFVECPACAISVPYATINIHLDMDCSAIGPPKKKKQKTKSSGLRSSSVANGAGNAGVSVIQETKLTDDAELEDTVGLPQTGSMSLQVPRGHPSRAKGLRINVNER